MNKATATVTVNRRSVDFAVTEIPTADIVRRDIMSRGFDGTTWHGSSKATARRAAKHGTFYRKVTGEFVAIVIFG